MSDHPYVLIVGAGPVGLMLACQLAKHHVPFRIIDKKPRLSHWVKACLLSSRSLDILADLGLAKAAIKLGQRTDQFDIYHNHHCLISSPYRLINTRFPFNLHLGQPYTETLLYHYLLDHHAHVFWQHELIDFSQTKDHISAQINTPYGLKTVQADFLIGADGASSQVRKCLELPFEGVSYPDHFIVLNAHLDWPLSHKVARLFYTEDGFLSVYPLPDQMMQLVVNIPLSEEGYYRNQKKPKLSDIERLFAKRCPFKGRLSDVRWLTFYKTHCRNIAHRIHQRVIFMGDAAYIVSPATGLGMNTGLQDAENLGWKLALIYQDIASFDLLHSYQIERQAVLARVKKMSHVLYHIFTLRSESSRVFRKKILTDAWAHASIRKKQISILMQKDVHYAKSPITQTLIDKIHSDKKPLSAGMSAKDVMLGSHYLGEIIASNHHALLLLTGTEPIDKPTFKQLENIALTIQQSPLNQWIRCYWIDAIGANNPHVQTIEDHQGLIHRAYQIHQPALYLIRPDRYIAFCQIPPKEQKLLTFITEKITKEP